MRQSAGTVTKGCVGGEDFAGIENSDRSAGTVTRCSIGDEDFDDLENGVRGCRGVGDLMVDVWLKSS